MKEYMLEAAAELDRCCSDDLLSNMIEVAI